MKLNVAAPSGVNYQLAPLTLDQSERIFTDGKPARQSQREMIAQCMTNAGDAKTSADLGGIPFGDYLKLSDAALEINGLKVEPKPGEVPAAVKPN